MFTVYNKALDEKADKKNGFRKGRKCRRQGRKSHTDSFSGRHARAGHLIRLEKDTYFFDEEGRILYHFVARGKRIEDRECVRDPDWFGWRARHSTGWKDHKYRHQWEHRSRK